MRVSRSELNILFVAVLTYCVMGIVVGSLINASNNVFIFYLVVGAISLFFCGLASSVGNGGSIYAVKFFLFMSFFILFFIFAFRNASAIDDRHYKVTFSNVINDGWFTYFLQGRGEPAYLIIVWIVSKFTDDYLYVQIVTALIPMLILMITFYKQRLNINLPIALYLFFTTFYFQMVSTNLSRMFFALAIVFAAIPYLLEKNTKKYCIYILVACLFHYSAFFMFLFVYYALNVSEAKIKRYTYIIYVMVPILFYLIGKFIVPLMASRYSIYGVNDDVSIGGLLGSLDTLPLVLVFIYFRKFIPNDQKEERIRARLLERVFAFSIIVQIAGQVVNLGRVKYYMNLFFIFGAAYIYTQIKSKSAKMLFCIILVAYGLIYLYTSQFNNVSHLERLIPYQNIFFTLE